MRTAQVLLAMLAAHHAPKAPSKLHWHSKWHSSQKTKQYFSFEIIMLEVLFRLPRPTTSSSKDVHGRLFLCLKSTEFKHYSTCDTRPIPTPQAAAFNFPQIIRSIRVPVNTATPFPR